MLHSISWSLYLSVLVIAIIIYYAFVWIVYFNGRMPALLLSNKQKAFSSNAEDYADDTMSKVQHITNELQSIFQHKQNRNELIMALHKSLQQYHDSDEYFKNIINEFIVHESLNKCSIHFSEEDLRVLWMK